MFWKFNLLTTSHIDTLLDKEEVTLHELMDEDDILQECKAQNRKLINFLVLPENMEELVRLITEEPADDVEEKIRYKYPNTACELLTSDVSQINDALAGSEELVKKLYAFLDTDSTLNPLLASFFSKVMGLLITRKSEMILEFLQSREDFVGTLLKHIGTSAIMDLLLRLLTCIESPEIRRAMIEWLNEQQIVQKLVNCIHKDYDEDIHCNAAQSLCDIIRLGREQVIQLQDRADPDPLLTTVEMEENVSKLLDNMLKDEAKNESVIVNGLSVIQTLLEFKKQGPEDSVEQMTTVDAEQMFLGVNNVLSAINPRLKDFHTILVEPPKQRFCVMPSSAGSLNPPLGNTRLQTGRLVASLLLTNTHSINVELAQLGTINVLIDLYFNYIWNNFLHTHVTQCLYTILSNPPIEVEGKKECPLLNQLFTECKLVQRILDEWDLNDQEQSKEAGRRKGFMGHLTRLANDVVNAQEKGENAETIKTLFTEQPDELKEKWEAFLTGTLAETNKRNTVELVQGHGLASSSEDDDADFSNIPFPQDTAMQQLQQMTSNFIDQFGFNEDEFGEHEEKTDSPFTDRISSIDFGGTVNEDVRPNASRFEQYCNERLQQFDNDSDEDIWEEKEITFSPSSQQKRSERLPVTRGSQDDSDSTDSEEELDSPKRITQQPGPAEKMDVDSNEAWSANFEQQQQQSGSTEGGPVAMDTSPWDSNNQDKQEQSDNWANFEKSTQGNTKEEKWAEFPNKTSDDSTNKDNWADFTSFDNMKSDGNEPRSSSPVAMDTTEPSSRTNAYLASNKEIDLKLESVDTTEEDLGTDVDKLVEANSESDSSSKQEQSNTDTSSDNSENVKTEAGSQSSSQTGSQSNKQTGSTSSTPAGSQSPDGNKSENQSSPDTTQTQSKIPEKAESPSEKPPTPPSSPLPEDEGAEPVPESPRSPPTPSTDCDSDKLNPDTNAQGDGCNTNEQQESPDDDLNSNFNFLTKVGLMKPAGAPNCVTPGQADIQGNGPTKDTPDISSDKLEELRAQAKDALESFDTATQSGANVQNGPV
ncbi:serine/threonine-protein phosphatase 6 regulatory subunit 3-like isoform X2 [Ruditapes philippinarum]|uniref:serine/threonine-protein phosphatase 6 regulatory subunit 3-like isoform X2 n=1 Tax=Ruditapes philippinarum TaxID=129788 RepID=UPI00295B31E3|nr:serine/threonine-protein phosphatase 6 regulatory subunit 3-like isoform X2 [Ruditapes philippinarum]